MKLKIIVVFSALWSACGLFGAELAPGGVVDEFGSEAYRKVYEATDKRVAMVQTTDTKPYVSIHGAMALFDNITAVFSHTPTPVTLVIRNVRKTFPKKVCVVVKLPKPFRLIGTTSPLKLLDADTKDKTTTYRFELDSQPPFRRFSSGSMRMFASVSLLLDADLEPDDRVYPMEYFLEYENTSTEPYVTSLQVAPKPANVTAPKLFLSGIIGTIDVAFEDPAAVKAFVKFYSDLGFNAFSGFITPNLMTALHQAGIQRFVENWFVGNGYNAYGVKVPPELNFHAADDKPHRSQSSLCPVQIYSRDQFFRDKVEKYIEDQFFRPGLVEFVMSNWEPEHFFKDGDGCFCDRCRDEFIAYTKLTREKVMAAWPQKIRSDYPAEWQSFRTRQHALVVKTINKVFKELSAKYNHNVFFLPLICWASLFPNCHKDWSWTSPKDYLDDFEYVEPWGPYINQVSRRSYSYRNGIHLLTYIAAKKIQEWYPDKKLLAFPIGALMGNIDWISTPEEIAFDTLTFFVNRWRGSLVYRFPQGYDARYWAALGQANALIAWHEKAILMGKPNGDVKFEPVSPLPPGLFQTLGDKQTRAMPPAFDLGLDKLSLLQGCSFDYDGKNTLALGNFWQRGEIFTRVKFPGTEPNKRYVLCEPTANRCFGDASGNEFLLGSELQKGVLLHVPALNWAFFTLEPYVPSRNYGKVISSPIIQRELTRRKYQIQLECNEEQSRYFSGTGCYQLKTSADGMNWRLRENYPANDKQLDTDPVKIALETGTLDRWAQLTFRLPNRLGRSRQKLDFTIIQPVPFILESALKCKTIAYLSDLDRRPSKIEQQYYKIEYDKECFTGKPIRLRNNDFPHGIGVHANSKLVFNLDPQEKWQYFTAWVGLSNHASATGTCEFKVYVDGNLCYNSGTVTLLNNPVAVCVKIVGAKELCLEVTDTGDGVEGDIADWADACFRK